MQRSSCVVNLWHNQNAEQRVEGVMSSIFVTTGNRSGRRKRNGRGGGRGGGGGGGGGGREGFEIIEDVADALS